MGRSRTLRHSYFNPHHREGGDLFSDFSIEDLCDFNPHHREGGDLKDKAHLPPHVISIHTTAKVVTVQKVRGKGHGHDFNPHHREGGDETIPAAWDSLVQFQSTPPRRW